MNEVILLSKTSNEMPKEKILTLRKNIFLIGVMIAYTILFLTGFKDAAKYQNQYIAVFFIYTRYFALFGNSG